MKYKQGPEEGLYANIYSAQGGKASSTLGLQTGVLVLSNQDYLNQLGGNDLEIDIIRLKNKFRHCAVSNYSFSEQNGCSDNNSLVAQLDQGLDERLRVATALQQVTTLSPLQRAEDA